MNQCKECKNVMDWTAFPKDKRMLSGHTNVCTVCIGRRYSTYRRNWEVQKDFGISLDEYNKRKTNCEICGATEKLHLDHNHHTRKLRGFLCVNCNMGIGQFKDNITKMKNAIQYLEKYGE